jgi:type IV secretion system protein TrbE
MLVTEVATGLTALAGGAFVALMGSAAYGSRRDLRVARHRGKGQGFADFLNYAAVVDDGIIVQKSGALMAAWVYRGPDNTSTSHEERGMVAARINRALRGLGNGWMLHVDAVRFASPGYPMRESASFPDPATVAIDEERRRFFEAQGQMYEGHFVLTLTWFPPARAQRRLTRLLVTDNAPDKDSRDQTLGVIEDFRRAIARIENELATALTLRRLKAVTPEEGAPLPDPDEPVYDEFLGWLQTCITGARHPVVLPRNPIYLDALIGGQDFWTGLTPRIGRRYVQVVSIEGLPLESHPGILSALAELGLEYRWSTRFIWLDGHEASAHLDKYRKKWRQKIRGFFDQFFRTASGAVDEHAVEMAQDASEAMAEVSSGEVGAGYYTSVVVLMDEDLDRAERAALSVAQALSKLGFGARVETVGVMDAYFGSLPGHGVENVVRPLINTMNLSDLLPTSSIWAGDPLSPCDKTGYLAQPALMQCVTQGATPFRLNLHVRDLGHTFVAGPSGAGKSTHLALIAAQLRRYPGMRVFAFDKDFAMLALTKAAGGAHFAPGRNEALAFCPLQFLEDRSDRAWAMEWIETLLTLQGMEVTVRHRNLIAEALVSMTNSGARRLSEFALTVQSESIREALKPYTADGLMGHLLDAEEDGLRLSTFTTFEMSELLGLGEKYLLPVLLYVFRRIERRMNGQPTVIILDEAWVMLGHKVFREKIREWLKVLRKQNTSVVMATQSISDAERSGILDVIVQETATKIFLPNASAREEKFAGFYRAMGLTGREIDIVATAIPKRQYFYTSASGRRLYELALGPLQMALLTVSGKEIADELDALESAFGGGWLREYLARRKLDLRDFARAEADAVTEAGSDGAAVMDHSRAETVDVG